MSTAVTFAVVLPGLLVAHNVADHWIQTHHQACTKGQPGWAGRIACASHVATYTLVTATTVALLWWTLDLAITPAGFVAGQAVSAVTHYWADRRTTLAWLARLVGKGEFYWLGQPRSVHARTRDALADSAFVDYAEGRTVTTTSGFPAYQPVDLVDSEGRLVPWDNQTLGTGAYALDQSWHWLWLGVAALLTAVL